jgi:site-specific DNA recombinase
MLRNERYTGRVIWSRRHKVRDPKTGRRVYRTKEGDKPIEGANQPELRILPDELWRAVEERRELVKRVYDDAGKRPGLLRSSAIRAPYLLSGLLKCANAAPISRLLLVAGAITLTRPMVAR